MARQKIKNIQSATHFVLRNKETLSSCSCDACTSLLKCEQRYLAKGSEKDRRALIAAVNKAYSKHKNLA